MGEREWHDARKSWPAFQSCFLPDLPINIGPTIYSRESNCFGKKLTHMDGKRLKSVEENFNVLCHGQLLRSLSLGVCPMDVDPTAEEEDWRETKKSWSESQKFSLLFSSLPLLFCIPCSVSSPFTLNFLYLPFRSLSLDLSFPLSVSRLVRDIWSLCFFTGPSPLLIFLRSILMPGVRAHSLQLQYELT